MRSIVGDTVLPGRGEMMAVCLSILWALHLMLPLSSASERRWQPNRLVWRLLASMSSVAKVLISASGSGQMLPLPMNEFIQQNLAEVGIKIDFEVVDWNTMINIWRAGAKHESNRNATAMNYSYFIQDPFTGVIRHLQCNLAPPAGTNYGHYCDADMDKLFDAVRNTFDAAEQTRVMQKIHEKYVDDALFLMVTHDVSPRALSPKVQGFKPAQNWFQNFSSITMAK